MADEVHLGILLQHRVETVEALVVAADLPMHQNRHAVGVGELIEFLHLGRIAFDVEFLFTDEHCPELEIFFDDRGGVGEIANLVGTEDEFGGEGSHESEAVLVAGNRAFEAVGAAVDGRGAKGVAARRE